MQRHKLFVSISAVCGLAIASIVTLVAPSAGAATVGTEAELRAAFSDTSETSIVLTANVNLTDCQNGQLFRGSTGVALTLDGAGFTITQTCPGDRVMETQGAGGLTLTSVTITGGDADGGAGQGVGGGISSATPGPLTLDHTTVTGNRVSGDIGGEGGGFFAAGPVTLTNSVVSNNVAMGGTSIFAGLGGGFAAGGTVQATDSTISGNVATGSEKSGGQSGGVFGNSPMTFTRSTLSDNIAQESAAGNSGYSGAIAINASLTLVNSTVTGNRAGGANGMTGGIAAGGPITLVYSTIAGNTAAEGSANVRFLGDTYDDVSFGSVVANPLGGAPNCGGTVMTSQGHNYDTDGTCGFTNALNGDVSSGVDPMLGTLADNSGPTMTMLPLTGSPLFDAIAMADCQAGDASGVVLDQRSVTRPQGAGCDIGAVEIEVALPPTTTTTTTMPTTTTTTMPSTTTTTMPSPTDTAPVAQPVRVTPTYTG